MNQRIIAASFALRLFRAAENEETLAALFAPFRATVGEPELRRLVADLVQRRVLELRGADRVRLTGHGLLFARDCDALFADVRKQLDSVVDRVEALERLEDTLQDVQAELDAEARRLTGSDDVDVYGLHPLGRQATRIRCALAGMLAAGFPMRGAAAGQSGAPS